MDRPNNGHRRHESRTDGSDAGMVTVVDLIRRQQGPVRIPSADEVDTVQFVDDLLGPTDRPDDQRGWLAKSAKLAGLAFGSLVLCGSVYAASTLNQHRPQQATTTTQNSILSGGGALLPNAMAAQLSPGAATTTHPAPPPATTVRAAPAPAPPQSASGRASNTVPAGSHPARQSNEPSAGPGSPIDVVRTFYQLVAVDPAMALRLISPSLLSGDISGFDSGFDTAWRELTNIELESVRQTSPDSAEAVIRMREPDGTWLRVVELLHVTGGDAPLINGAELLSAQHG